MKSNQSQLINLLQIERCWAIVFDSYGSIIVSTQLKKIKVWSSLNGTIKLQTKLQGHNDSTKCLILVRNRIRLLQVTIKQDAENNWAQLIGLIHNLIKSINYLQEGLH
ncbi:unnamed protein product [Paramecium pentaurelia]|uniref:Uncharacterized protein n=1 Tax=Paramecium pentaurelia TaxID=43138 RepID=A0A8S1YMW7_9CILI|nr:unnamed protein product [Paramecium pentaurelia]